MNFKRITAAVITVVMMLSTIPFAASAEVITLKNTLSATPRNRYFQPEAAVATVAEELDVTAAAEYIGKELEKYPETIDISAFALPATAECLQAIADILFYETPTAFHFVTCDASYIDTTFVELIPYYNIDAATYSTMLATCKTAAAAMTADLHTNALTDAEKALLLHDRIAAACEYNTAAPSTLTTESFNMYGVFGLNKAVCQGYAMAYHYLLDLVGIENYFCSSAELVHAWNIVVIDGEKYHVDVTWDDPTHDVTGQVLHNNFLVSTQQLIQTGHDAADYDTSPTSTAYDNAFWQSSYAEFQLVNGEIYYIDNGAGTINAYKDHSAICSVQDIWLASATQCWSANFARLDSDGTSLLFSLTDGIYLLDLNTKQTACLFMPDRTVGDFFSVYGFKLQNDTLYCDLYNSPAFTATTKADYQVTAPFFNKNSTSGAIMLIQFLLGENVQLDISYADQNNDNRLTIADVILFLRRLSTL